MYTSRDCTLIPVAPFVIMQQQIPKYKNLFLISKIFFLNITFLIIVANLIVIQLSKISIMGFNNDL